MIRSYYALTKPGIIFGNVVTAIGGFLLASKGKIDYGLLLIMLLGMSCIIGSACILNNYIDREIDRKMQRTKERPFAKGVISIKKAMVLAFILNALGAHLLFYYTNFLTLGVALLGFFIYVVLYSIVLKQHSTYATAVGSIAGATPPVIGYCAVTGQLDIAALILFLMVALWQMPHFFAIAMYRLEDYAAALIPVLPVVKGVQVTKKRILFYILAFTIASCMLFVFHHTGYIHLILANVLGLIWLYLGLKGFKQNDNRLWARKMFVFSLVVIVMLSIVISIDQAFALSILDV